MDIRSSERIEIVNRVGYGAPATYHTLAVGIGWVVGPCSIDQRLVPAIIDAIKAGTLPPDIARIEPLR